MARSKTTEGTTVSHLWMDSGFRAKLAGVAGCIAMAALLSLGTSVRLHLRLQQREDVLISHSPSYATDLCEE